MPKNLVLTKYKTKMKGDKAVITTDQLGMALLIGLAQIGVRAASDTVYDAYARLKNDFLEVPEDAREDAKVDLASSSFTDKDPVAVGEWVTLDDAEDSPTLARVVTYDYQRDAAGHGHYTFLGYTKTEHDWVVWDLDEVDLVPFNGSLYFPVEGVADAFKEYIGRVGE